MIEKKFTQRITVEEMLTEVKREIAMRKSVYPRWIESGKIKKETADLRVLILEALQIFLDSEIKKTAPQPSMF
jgi:hypothetical protein